MHKPGFASRTLASLALPLILASCATSSVPSPPAPEVKIPSPPVRPGPELSLDWQQKAQSYSSKVQAYVEKLQKLQPSAPPK